MHRGWLEKECRQVAGESLEGWFRNLEPNLGIPPWYPTNSCLGFGTWNPILVADEKSIGKWSHHMKCGTDGKRRTEEKEKSFQLNQVTSYGFIFWTKWLHCRNQVASFGFIFWTKWPHLVLYFEPSGLIWFYNFIAPCASILNIWPIHCALERRLNYTGGKRKAGWQVGRESQQEDSGKCQKNQTSK